VDKLRNRGHVLNHAEIVRGLQDQTRDVCIQGKLHRVEIEPAALVRHDRYFRIRAERIGLDRLERFGVESRSKQWHRAAALAAHGGGFRRSGCAVVYGGVARIHTGEFTEHGLVFEYRLQNALADLRLIGGIRGDKRFLCGNAAHHGGDMVPVSTRAAEDRVKHAVLLR